MSSIGQRIAERDSEMMIEEPSRNAGLNPFLPGVSSITGSGGARERNFAQESSRLDSMFEGKDEEMKIV